jgi:hypothetical protein
VSDDLWDQGLGYVCLSRELPNGAVAFAMFLVDRYCLGVKNALVEITSRATYDSRIEDKMRRECETEDVTPAAARKIVERAVEYARSLGFHPHPDYQKAKHIFGSIDPNECKEEFEFGKDGKPFFIAGPRDTPERCRRIMKTLEQSTGPGGSHFMVPISPGMEILPLSDDEEGLEEIDMEETSADADHRIGFSEEEESDEG